MGKPHDLITGAVFQVSGQMDAARILSDDRIVILRCSRSPGRLPLLYGVLCATNCASPALGFPS